MNLITSFTYRNPKQHDKMLLGVLQPHLSPSSPALLWLWSRRRRRRGRDSPSVERGGARQAQERPEGARHQLAQSVRARAGEDESPVQELLPGVQEEARSRPGRRRVLPVAR